MSRYQSRFGRRALQFALVLVALSATAYACQVPVFRYALERWAVDRYRITVLTDDSLDEPQSSALARLKEVAESKDGARGTVDLRVINLNQQQQVPGALMAKWKARESGSGPLVLVDYPAANGVPRDAPMFEAELNETNVDLMLDSPVRKEIAQRLANGHSAVWIFIPCGKEADDTAALDRLEMQLREDEKWLELPSADELEVNPEVLEQVKVPLQIKFSSVILDRADPKEAFLLNSLIHSEEDLVEFDQPLAFPVFGQGRVLYALVGQGIVADTVRTASSFIAGPCSCQVKNQNPGFDLLLQSDWKKALGDVLISEPIETVDREANAPKLLTIPPGRQGR